MAEVDRAVNKRHLLPRQEHGAAAGSDKEQYSSTTTTTNHLPQPAFSPSVVFVAALGNASSRRTASLASGADIGCLSNSGV